MPKLTSRAACGRAEWAGVCWLGRDIEATCGRFDDLPRTGGGCVARPEPPPPPPPPTPTSRHITHYSYLSHHNTYTCPITPGTNASAKNLATFAKKATSGKLFWGEEGGQRKENEDPPKRFHLTPKLIVSIREPVTTYRRLTCIWYLQTPGIAASTPPFFYFLYAHDRQ